MKLPPEKKFKVNEYLTLKLEESQTNIYVNGKFFRQCKYLLLDIPTEVLEDYDEIDFLYYQDLSCKLNISLNFLSLE